MYCVCFCNVYNVTNESPLQIDILRILVYQNMKTRGDTTWISACPNLLTEPRTLSSSGKEKAPPPPKSMSGVLFWVSSGLSNLQLVQGSSCLTGFKLFDRIREMTMHAVARGHPVGQVSSCLTGFVLLVGVHSVGLGSPCLTGFVLLDWFRPFGQGFALLVRVHTIEQGRLPVGQSSPCWTRFILLNKLLPTGQSSPYWTRHARLDRIHTCMSLWEYLLM